MADRAEDHGNGDAAVTGAEGVRGLRASSALWDDRAAHDDDGEEPYVGEHVMVLGSDFLNGEFTSECSCGWAWDFAGSQQDATDAWDNHCDVVFMESTQEMRDLYG